MISKLSWTALGLALAACAPMSSSLAMDQQAVATADTSACQESHFPMTVGGRTVEATAHSCQQPDGSLEVTQETPGLPVQIYRLPAASGAPEQMTATPSGCRDYTVSVTVNGAKRQAKRHVCPQADGSWQVTQSMRGLPDQSYVIPAAEGTNPSPAANSYSAANPYPATTPYPVDYPAYPYPYPYCGYPYPCPSYAYYPYWWDGWAFPPPFFVSGAFFFGDRFHRDHFRDGHFHDGHFHDGHFADHRFDGNRGSGHPFMQGGGMASRGMGGFHGGGMMGGGGHGGGGGHR